MSASLLPRPTDTASGSLSHLNYRPVLVVISNSSHRAIVVDACRTAGVPVCSVGSVAEVERWPVDETVVTDVEHVTPFWRTVGVADVIVLVHNAEEGHAALHRGATAWLQLPVTLAAVVAFARAYTLQGRPPAGAI